MVEKEYKGLVTLVEFIGNYGIPYDIVLRLLEHKLLSYKYISNKKGGGKDPYIKMTPRTWGTMHAIKRKLPNFLNGFRGDFLTVKEAARIFGIMGSERRIIKLLNDYVLTERKPSFKISALSTNNGMNKRSTFIVIDWFFIEYFRAHGLISYEETPESIIDKAFSHSLRKLLITY